MQAPDNPRSTVALTLLGVGGACIAASWCVAALASDKRATELYLAENSDPEIDAETPAAEPAGDPVPVVDGSDNA